MDTSYIGEYLPFPTQDSCYGDTSCQNFTETDSIIYSDSIAYPDSIVKLISTNFYCGANKIVTLELYPICFVGEDTLVYGNDTIAFTLHTSSSNDTGIVPSMITILGKSDLEKNLREQNNYGRERKKI